MTPTENTARKPHRAASRKPMTHALHRAWEEIEMSVEAAAYPQSDLDEFEPEVDLPLDPGIRHAVLVLRSAGVETFESCEGGQGHSFPDPTIRFHGNAWAGYTAFAVAMEHELPVLELRRVHDVYDGQLVGPWWALVFRPGVRSLVHRAASQEQNGGEG